MGSKWEVNGYRYEEEEGFASWELLYMGDSFFRAAWTFFKYRNRFGCVKLERR